MLTGVSAVGDAETKVKIKGLEQPVSKVVSLYHSELLHWLIPHCELDPEEEEEEEREEEEREEKEEGRERRRRRGRMRRRGRGRRRRRRRRYVIMKNV